MFITFEGGEGAGKTTQIQFLKNELERRQHAVILSREPGGTETCEHIRSLLLSHEWAPLTETFLFSANRHEHCIRLIEPSLRAGKIVLCDRFMDSTMVYQGYGLGLSLPFLKQLQDHVVRVPPDLTFIFDLDPDVARSRIQSRGHINYIDERDPSFHERIRQGFLTLAHENQHRCVVIDAAKECDAIRLEILSTVLHHPLFSSQLCE